MRRRELLSGSIAVTAYAALPDKASALTPQQRRAVLGGGGRAAVYRMAADRLMEHTVGPSTGQPSGFNIATSATYRIRRTVPANIFASGNLSLILTYVNWYCATSPSVGEFNGPTNPITVSLGIEYNTNGALLQWSPADAGARYVNSDMIGVTIAAGGAADAHVTIPLSSGAFVFYELVYVAGASGWPVGITLLAAGLHYDQYSIGNDYHAGSAAWTNGGVAGFSAVKIKALSSVSVKGYLGIADSIMKGQGYNPSDASFMDFGCGLVLGATPTQETKSLHKLALSSDQASLWTAGSTLRRSLIKADEISAIFYHLGTNDLSNSRTLVQLQADTTANLALLAAFGRPIHLVTLLPRTNSSNVSIGTTYKDARNGYNAWLYTLIGSSGVVGVFDAAAAVENAPGSQAGTGDNTWTNIRRFVDGIHPSGGATSTGTDGIIGTTTAGGGHQLIGSALATYLAGI